MLRAAQVARLPDEAKRPELVTILTPVYNGADFIEETLDSVLSQGYPNLEYVVLDDGSTDETLRILERYGGRIRVVSHSNMGETRTANKGLGLAQGEFVAVVNADDPLRPGAIAALVAALRLNPEATLAYPDWVEIDPGSTVLKEVRLPLYDLRSMLERFNVGMGPGVLIRRRVLDAVGLRDTSLRYAADIDLWFRFALQGPFVHVPELLATHRVHPASASVSDRGSQMAEAVVRVAHKCFDDPRLPEQLRRQRNAILGRAHFDASFFCGRNLKARIAHLIESTMYAPNLFPVIAYRHLRYMVLVRIPEQLRKALKRMLDRDHPAHP